MCVQDRTHSLGIRMRPTYATKFLAKPATVRRSAGVMPAPNCKCPGPRRSSSSSSCDKTQCVEAGKRHTNTHTQTHQTMPAAGSLCTQRLHLDQASAVLLRALLPAGQRTCGTVTGASIMGCPLMLMKGTPPNRCDSTQPQLSLCGIGSATPMTASACKSLSAWGRVHACTEAAAGDVCVRRCSRQQQGMCVHAEAAGSSRTQSAVRHRCLPGWTQWAPRGLVDCTSLCWPLLPALQANCCADGSRV